MSSLYNNVWEGDFFMLLLVVIWGLLMAGVCYKLAGYTGLNQKWQRISAIGGFVSLGAGIIVILGRWVYKTFWGRTNE
jgi:hypothetical protein